MQSLKRFLSTSFGSAVAGGTVVLVVGLILIQAGVVDTSKDQSSAPVIEPAALARPASNSNQGLTVHDIYQRDGERRGLHPLDDRAEDTVRVRFPAAAVEPGHGLRAS